MLTIPDPLPLGKTEPKIAFESRYACSPTEVKGMDTEQLRQNFLIETLFVPDQFRWVLSFFDRYLTGGVMPIIGTLTLETPDQLKASLFSGTPRTGHHQCRRAGAGTGR